MTTNYLNFKIIIVGDVNEEKNVGVFVWEMCYTISAEEFYYVYVCKVADL